MKIKALQRTTLIDYPGKVACTIFLFGCNFRCGFCHNPELVIKDTLPDISKENILDFLKKRRKYLDGVCITGGEPLMSLEKDFLEQIKKEGYLIKLDTNGSFPRRLKEFIDAGLIDFVSIDIKASKENYGFVANAGVDLEKIEESIQIISCLKEYEFRTTIIEKLHSEEDTRKMIEWVYKITGKKAKKFVLQGFKNSGKMINEDFLKEKNTSPQFLENLKKIIEPFAERVDIRV